MRTCVCVRMRVCMCVCVNVNVNVNMSMSVCACVCECMRANELGEKGFFLEIYLSAIQMKLTPDIPKSIMKNKKVLTKYMKTLQFTVKNYPSVEHIFTSKVF